MKEKIDLQIKNLVSNDAITHITIKQVKSGAGRIKKQRLTLSALGLKMNKEVAVPNNPSVIGMIKAISHLVKIID